MKSNTGLLAPRALSLPELAPYANYVFLDMDFGFGKGAIISDKSPFHSHGTIVGATWAAGLHHRCLDFDGDDYVEVPASHTQLNFTSEDFSLIARIKIDSITDYPKVFNRGLYQVDGYFIQYDENGAVVFITSQTSTAVQLTLSANGELTTATWYTLGISRNGSSVRLYKNGLDITDVAGTHTNPSTCARSAKIGIYDDKVADGVDGKIEFARVFGGIALPATAHAWYHNNLK